MILLDTDHLTVLQVRAGERYARLIVRLAESMEPLATTVVNVEEQARGWLAVITREKRIDRQVRAYGEFAELFERFRAFTIVRFDEAAAAAYAAVRKGRGHIGMRDMKIAATAISRDALLLTANSSDFAAIPGLRFENWLDD